MTTLKEHIQQETEQRLSLGWDIFCIDGVDYQLQALDDPESNAADFEIEIGTAYEGDDRDQQAATDCQRLADEGNTVCRHAIEFLIERNSPDVETFQLRKTW